jgi:GNAT superfamily N-acetyltransferase
MGKFHNMNSEFTQVHKIMPEIQEAYDRLLSNLDKRDLRSVTAVDLLKALITAHSTTLNCIVIRLNDKIGGILVYNTGKDKLDNYTFVNINSIIATYRNLGIGEYLINIIKHYANANHFDYVMVPNAVFGARQFYEKKGFKPDFTRPTSVNSLIYVIRGFE